MTLSPNFKELIAVRVMKEQEWAYEQRSRHLSYREMRRRTHLPKEQGGLGYDLSEHALKGLVNGYLERMRDTLQEQPEFYMYRELSDLEEQYRAAAEMVSPIDRERTLIAAYLAGYDDVDAYLKAEPSGFVLRDEKVRLAALVALRQINERRAKLLGLDAVQTHKLDVTVTDAVDADIARLAAELEGAAL